MLQKIETLESNVNTIVLIPCPHCGQYSEEDMQTVFDAHKDNLPLVHLDCGKEFYVELYCSTRAAELLRAPVQSEQNEASRKQDIVEMVNSLGNMIIQASSQGYVSSNDIDFANDCLDRVIPMLRLRSNRSDGG